MLVSYHSFTFVEALCSCHHREGLAAGPTAGFLKMGLRAGSYVDHSSTPYKPSTIYGHQ